MAAVVSVGLLFVAGCAATKDARRAHRARLDIAGLTRAELQRCAGIPIRVQRGAGWEYITYVSTEHEESERYERCVATFRLRNGYVEELDYETASGRVIGKNIRECLSIVDPCLDLQANAGTPPLAQGSGPIDSERKREKASR